MGAHSHWQDGALAVRWKIYYATFASITTFWFVQKGTKIAATRYVSPIQNIPKLQLRLGLFPRPHWQALPQTPLGGSAADPLGGSAPYPTRRLTAQPRTHCCIYGIHFAAQKKRYRVDIAWRKGRVWQQKNGEESKEVDFAPACNNSCGCTCLLSKF